MSELPAPTSTPTPAPTPTPPTQTAKNTQKFENDDIYESPFDTYIFNPLSERLVTPAHNLRLTPNAVTTISKVFEVSALLLLLTDHCAWAGILYLVGYICDCVDGKLARKYDMCSKFGMMYDFNSDMLVHTPILLAICIRNQFYFSQVAFLLGSVVVANIYYGLVRAIYCHKKKGTDDFYSQLKEELKDEKPQWFVSLFMMFHWSAFDSYRSLMHAYDDRRAHQYMRVLKYYGPGSFAVTIFAMLFFDLGQYCRYTVWEVFSFMNSLNPVVGALVSVAFAVTVYLHSGRDSKYVALRVVHYGGILMGMIITMASPDQLSRSCGIVLLTFHVCYEVDCRLVRQIWEMTFAKDRVDKTHRHTE